MTPSSPSVRTKSDAEALFVEHLDRLERIVAFACRRHGLLGDLCEEFRSYVHLKLIEDEYGILRKFRGESAFTTYLNTVVQNLSRDFRNSRWGKWRPTVAARRLGEAAVRLERLVVRDRYTVEEAIEVLRTNFQVDETAAQLRDIAAQLPERPPRQYLGEETLERLPAGTDSAGDPQQGLRDAERASTQERTQVALEEALTTLDDDDRLLLELHFRQGMTLALIARTLELKQRSMYSRMDKCLRVLRRHLEAAGLEGEAVLETLGWSGGEIHVVLGAAEDGSRAHHQETG